MHCLSEFGRRVTSKYVQICTRHICFYRNLNATEETRVGVFFCAVLTTCVCSFRVAIVFRSKTSGKERSEAVNAVRQKTSTTELEGSLRG